MRRKMGAPGRTFILKVEEGEEVVEAVARLVEAQGLEAAMVTGIGGFSEAEIGYFKPGENAYYVAKITPENGFVIEVASLTGNAVATGDGVNVHLHAVLESGPGRVYAGHLVRGVARPHAEIFVVEVITSPLGALEAWPHREKVSVSFKRLEEASHG